MKKFYVASMHNVVKALAAANVIFPVSKKDLLDHAGSAMIQIDFDEKISLNDYCKDIKISSFENKSQFFNALVGSTTKL